MRKKSILILLIIFVLFLMVGCNNDPVEVSYTIKFDSNSSNVYEDIIIDKKTTINLPTPEKEGYIFAGWYPSEEYVLGTEVTKQTVIGKNVTLHAKWNPIELIITYDLSGGHFKDGTTSKTVKTYYNEKASLERAYKDNHLFMGWFIDGIEVTENTVFTSNATVTANYLSMETLQSEYKLNLVLDGGSFYDYWWNYRVEEFVSFVFKKDNTEENLDEYSYTYIRTVGDFMYDFFMFKKAAEHEKTKYSRHKFVSLSNESLIGEGSFLGTTKYYDKWIWLFEYLAINASEENKPYFKKLINGEYTAKPSAYATEAKAIAAELTAFLCGTDNYVEKNKVYETADYSNEEIREGYIDLLGLTKYTTGEGVILLTPYKRNYTFLGWYDNPDFEGDPIKEIKYNEYGEKTYYANWLKRG